MKKYIYIILLTVMAVSACKKIDLTNGYELPEGWIRGTLVWADQTIAPDYYMLIENTDNGAQDFTYAFEDGLFAINRMAAGNYAMSVFNDSVRFSNELVFSLGDGEDKDLGNLQVEVVPYPETSVSLIAANQESLDLRVDVIENGNAIRGRGIAYMLASEPGDPAELGTKKSVKYPPEREYWEQSLTGLDPDTEYKMKSYVYIYRGLTASGSTKIVYIYSDEVTFTTASASK